MHLGKALSTILIYFLFGYSKITHDPIWFTQECKNLENYESVLPSASMAKKSTSYVSP